MKTNEDYYIETYGLKSWRKKDQLRKWDRDKSLLRLEKEALKLWCEMQNPGFTELEYPIQKGWKRFYVLREDIAKSKEGAFYQSILDKINTVVVCKRKDFLNKSRRTKKLNPIQQHTQRFKESEFVKLNFTSRQKEMFEYKWIKEQDDEKRYRRFVYLNDWQFEFRIQKNFITHVQAHDAVLEKRLAELNKEVDSFTNYNRLQKIHGKGVYKYWKRGWTKEKEESFDGKWWVSHLDDDN